ncbi:MAG TPA: DNA repair protein RadA, partial [Steroidobacteraceae bacterium]|nr:DNA repair protein RadA [Steroidobacteraceae bacterium]
VTEIAQERDDVRAATGSGELDRVLGGGLVAGSVVLLGGDPGIGKSTLLLQAADALSRERPVLYVSGEESVRQVASRAQRLGLESASLRLAAETRVEAVIEEAVAARAQVVVVDSIQTMQTELSESSAGSAVQVRESAARLVRFAKESGAAVLLIGHVTKEGQIAGPRILEHMVDTVLYFESDPASRFRVVRAVKNRFGSANELGVFAMVEQGLREVRNPSAIFLSRHPQPVPGSVVTVVREGSRPLLVEVQALADDAQGMNPRRVAVGFESSRLALLLAVLHRHGGVSTAGRDVFVNVVGGVRIGETSADLPAVLAVLSSVRDKPVAVDTVCFGELGLTGEIRPVPFGEERLREAAKQGFRRALVPTANVPRQGAQVDGIAVEGVGRLQEALDRAF